MINSRESKHFTQKEEESAVVFQRAVESTDPLSHINYLHQAAEFDHPDALLLLAKYYECGFDIVDDNGVQCSLGGNRQDAVRYYEKLFEQKDLEVFKEEIPADFINLLIEVNFPEAERWYRLITHKLNKNEFLISYLHGRMADSYRERGDFDNAFLSKTQYYLSLNTGIFEQPSQILLLNYYLHCTDKNNKDMMNLAALLDVNWEKSADFFLLQNEIARLAREETKEFDSLIKNIPLGRIQFVLKHLPPELLASAETRLKFYFKSVNNFLKLLPSNLNLTKDDVMSFDPIIKAKVKEYFNDPFLPFKTGIRYEMKWVSQKCLFPQIEQKNEEVILSPPSLSISSSSQSLIAKYSDLGREKRKNGEDDYQLALKARNPQDFFTHLNRAGSQDHAEALYMIGYIYEKGLHNLKTKKPVYCQNQEMAVEFYHQSVKQGGLRACEALIKIWRYHDILPSNINLKENFSEIEKWYHSYLTMYKYDLHDRDYSYRQDFEWFAYICQKSNKLNHALFFYILANRLSFFDELKKKGELTDERLFLIGMSPRTGDFLLSTDDESALFDDFNKLARKEIISDSGIRYPFDELLKQVPLGKIPCILKNLNSETRAILENKNRLGSFLAAQNDFLKNRPPELSEADVVSFLPERREKVEHYFHTYIQQTKKLLDTNLQCISDLTNLVLSYSATSHLVGLFGRSESKFLKNSNSEKKMSPQIVQYESASHFILLPKMM